MTHAFPARFIDAELSSSDRRTAEDCRGSETLRIHVQLTGLVQGVGFRPFVYRVAKRLRLAGMVHNTSGGVEIEVQGTPRRVEAFLQALREEAPPIAEIGRIEIARIEQTGDQEFQIVESLSSRVEAALISPDVATCDDCLREMRDPGNRRYRYPFINCTNCGPRFTIVEAVPYDRAQTTMRGFELCPACAGEYREPTDRRFHAEPNACPACGPRVELVDSSGRGLARDDKAIEAAREKLGCGQILAVKGLGGFHLACDATCEKAVSRLRRLKGRPHKALAVMCRDLPVARGYCEISAGEARELTGVRRPILLLRRRSRPEADLAPIAAGVAPCSDDLGVMLPYTPLHHLLIEQGGSPCLVMTSGNLCTQPIVADNRAALAGLGKIADVFLIHDRPIWNRCDDSVGFVENDRLVLTRRSRGFAPAPVSLAHEVGPTLALGAMTSNTFAIATGRRAFLSQHIGDVDNLETLALMRESIEKFSRWLGIEPALVVHDLHPDLLTTHMAHELSAGRRRIGVQHHHAHLAAAMASAGLTGEAQGLVLDGTGWGPDRTIWGGELLVGSEARFRRAGSLRPLPLPGGDAAIRRPLRTAVAYLDVLVPAAADAPLELWRRARPEEVSALRHMIQRGFNTPLTSSAGRLFDAVAALLGVRDETTYEGQAAIELEQLARSGDSSRGPVLRLDLTEQDGRIVIDPEPLFSKLVEAVLDGVPGADLAAGFHAALAGAAACACARVRDEGGPAVVVLCGGVFQNRILTRLTALALQAAGLDPVLPGTIPVNDGGLALGQVLVANAKMAAEVGHEEGE